MAVAAFGLALGHGAAVAQDLPDDQITDVGVAPPVASDVQTGLSGRVVLTLRCPVPLGADEGSTCPTLPVTTTLGVRSADGSTDIATVATDADGQFSVLLEPGQYQVVVPGPGGVRLPAQTLPVTVLADGPTSLTIQVRPSPHIVP